MSRDPFIGLDWGDLKDAFGVVHTAGGAVLSAFGAGALVKPLANLEAGAGILPDWAQGGSAAAAAGAIAVGSPDYVVVQRVGGAKPDVLSGIAKVVVRGGRRFDGNGYRSGDVPGATFSFGYDAPAGVAVVLKSGQTQNYADAQRVLFLGGSEGVSVVGYENPNPGRTGMSEEDEVAEILSEVCGETGSYPELVGDLRTGSYLELVGDLRTGSYLELVGDLRTGSYLELVGAGSMYRSGTDILGAGGNIAPPPAGKKKPKVLVNLRIAKPSLAKDPYKRVVKNAANVVQMGKQVGKAAFSSAASYKPSDHKTVIPLKQVSVLGGVILGTDKPLTPAQMRAVQNHVNAMSKHALAASRAKDAGNRVTKVANDLDSFISKNKGVLAKALKAKKISIQGDTDIVGGHARRFEKFGRSILGGHARRLEDLGRMDGGYILGDDLFQEDNLEDLNYQILGDDPNAQGGDAGGFPALQTYDVNSDPNIVPLPVRGQPLSQDEAQVSYRGQQMPDDGVVLPDQGVPNAALMSYAVAYGPQPTEHGSGGDRNLYPPGYIWLNGRWNYYSVDANGLSGPVENVQRDSEQGGYGPLIGNPNMNLAGIQHASKYPDGSAPADGVWFWQASKAPVWATYVADQILVAANNKIAATDKAAVDAQNAIILQDQAAAAEEAAKQNAAIALAQQQADAQTAIVNQQLADQQAQFDQQQAQHQAEMDSQAQQFAPQGGDDQGAPGPGQGVDWGDGSNPDAFSAQQDAYAADVNAQMDEAAQ